LALVRYKEAHDSGLEWVHNGADIPGEKVIWAREIPGRDIQPLLDYFKGRKVWLVEPDENPPALRDYSGPLAPEAVPELPNNLQPSAPAAPGGRK